MFIEADLVDQLFKSSENRLAMLLLVMANFGKEGRPGDYDLSKCPTGHILSQDACRDAKRSPPFGIAGRMIPSAIMPTTLS